MHVRGDISSSLERSRLKIRFNKGMGYILPSDITRESHASLYRVNQTELGSPMGPSQRQPSFAAVLRPSGIARHRSAKQLPPASFSEPRLRLEDIVSLDTSGPRQARSVVHAPSLRLFQLRETQLRNKDSSSRLKETLSFWYKNFKHSQRLVRMHSIFWNSPEGYASILLDHPTKGCLSKVLDFYETLPEPAIRTIATQLLEALAELHNFDRVHGEISLSNVIFDRHGNVKVMPPLLEERCAEGERFLFADDNPQDDQSELQAKDIYDYGMLILKLGVGKLDLYGFSGDKFGVSPREKGRGCCMLHNILEGEKQFVETNSSVWENSTGIATTTTEFGQILLRKALSRLGNKFINFICLCMRRVQNKKITVKELWEHPFLREKEQMSGCTLDLNDLLEPPLTWFAPAVRDQETSMRHFKQLLEKLSIALANCEQSGNFKVIIQTNIIATLGNRKVKCPVVDEIVSRFSLPETTVREQMKQLYSDLSLS
eukprot:TRINITY_DN10277_c0_g1_i2.p1 TRINITY_DN10277_c0_g1~~TRINITY_DN10277_c0_g1_i2.p1  ORF type:complete len:487 (-),score=71.53 TRINITY_DN10277_c0_g1_i2:104-1564(-)